MDSLTNEPTDYGDIKTYFNERGLAGHNIPGGVAGLAGIIVVLSIALFLLTVGILIAIQGNTSIVSDQLATQADRAQFLAQTGIDDALMKLARDKTYAGSYVIAEADGTVNVSVVNSAGSSTIVSTSTVVIGNNTVKHTIQANAIMNGDGVITSATRINL